MIIEQKAKDVIKRVERLERKFKVLEDLWTPVVRAGGGDISLREIIDQWRAIDERPPLS